LYPCWILCTPRWVQMTYPSEWMTVFGDVAPQQHWNLSLMTVFLLNWSHQLFVPIALTQCHAVSENVCDTAENLDELTAIARVIQLFSLNCLARFPFRNSSFQHMTKFWADWWDLNDFLRRNPIPATLRTRLISHVRDLALVCERRWELLFLSA
jgi:hypothetical protein